MECQQRMRRSEEESNVHFRTKLFNKQNKAFTSWTPYQSRGESRKWNWLENGMMRISLKNRKGKESVEKIYKHSSGTCGILWKDQKEKKRYDVRVPEEEKQEGCWGWWDGGFQRALRSSGGGWFLDGGDGLTGLGMCYSSSKHTI